MKEMLEAGVHFGHQTRRWHPRMKKYIYGGRNEIHILDLQQTVKLLEHAYEFVRNTVGAGGTVMFVGTKRQAQEAVQEAAQRCNMFWVNQRWLGGMLTNFRTIRQRIDRLQGLRAQRDSGQFDRLPKKEAARLSEEMEKLERLLSGVESMKSLPNVVYIIDLKKEHIALAESNRMGIAVVAIVDTNCDPEGVDYVIPANDDAIRAIKLITGKMADAVLEGIRLREAAAAEGVAVPAAAPLEAEIAAPEAPAEEAEFKFDEELDKYTAMAKDLGVEEE
jgi:small subunit ribosomal protein S2